MEMETGNVVRWDGWYDLIKLATVFSSQEGGGEREKGLEDQNVGT